MNDQLYIRLYEIREVADENIEEYQNLFEKIYESRDSTTFRKLCSVLIDESPYGNTSTIYGMWREYVEGYHYKDSDDDINDTIKYINQILINSDAFIPNARKILQMSLIRILNVETYEQYFLESVNEMFYDERLKYEIIKNCLEDFKNEGFEIEALDRILGKM
ncbi:MAG: hypothetical protein MUF58_18595 [Arcicella sp.]|jgi:hypothetical protein|nr:hypothetical protein [Arcicella sp.]